MSMFIVHSLPKLTWALFSPWLPVSLQEFIFRGLSGIKRDYLFLLSVTRNLYVEDTEVQLIDETKKISEETGRNF